MAVFQNILSNIRIRIRIVELELELELELFLCHINLTIGTIIHELSIVLWERLQLMLSNWIIQTAEKKALRMFVGVHGQAGSMQGKPVLENQPGCR